jgi:acetylglutamate kinase
VSTPPRERSGDEPLGRGSIGTLLEALPYIREFHGQTVVIKYGGAAMSDPALREDFARDVVLLKYVGLNPIVVHGGGPDITAYMKRLNMPVEFVGGLRVSDPDTVEIAKMVLVGKVNKDIVMRLNRHGQPAVGLSGDDGQLFRVSTMEGPGGEDIGLVGKVERVDATVIHHIAEDYIPVIASVGADRAGQSHNVNADEAAGAVARATGAYQVIFLTDVPGWLRDPSDPTSVISECGADEVEAALPAAVGGMRPKLQACIEAIHGGVSFAHIIDGRQPHSLLLELFTDAGVGTKVRPAT